MATVISVSRAKREVLRRVEAALEQSPTFTLNEGEGQLHLTIDLADPHRLEAAGVVIRRDFAAVTVVTAGKRQISRLKPRKARRAAR